MAIRRRMTQRRPARGAPDEQKRKIDRDGLQLYRRLLSYVTPYRGWLSISIAALLVSSILGLVLPYVIQQIVDVVIVDVEEVASNRALLNRWAIGLIAIFAIQAVFSFVHQITLSYIGANTVQNLRADLFGRIQAQSLRFFADQSTGELVSRITNDVQLVHASITSNLVALLRQAVTLIGAAILLFVLNLRLTALILVGIPIMSLTMVWLGRKIRAASKEVQEAVAEASSVVEESVSGIRVVKSFAREPYEQGRFGAAVDRVFGASMRRAWIQSILSPVIGFMAFFSISFTLWFGALEVINGNMTAGQLVSYLVYTMLVATPVATLAGLYAEFQSALGASERIFELMDSVPDIQDKPNALALPAVRGRVRFEEVTFEYNADLPVLKQVSFTAEPGQIIAIVGPSGAGKSTLVNLIPRFYDVTQGAVAVDGQDVRDVKVATLRGQIGIVPQETTLFSDTVEANIRYGKLDASLEEVVAAAQAANAHDFIAQDLPNGYETLVGERGVKLSGGQRQRIAIARALLKDPRILILDEATSSLDSESEHLVQEALERLMAGRTSFVIAHRLSTVQNADWILVLDRGRLVEQGTHAELLALSDGLYTRLHAMQFNSAESR